MKRMGKAEALKKVKAILRTGNVIFTGHARQRMKERGFDTQDVEHVLKNGAIFKEAEPHPRTGKWNYNIEGKTVDGNNLRVTVEIRPNNVIVISTM